MGLLIKIVKQNWVKTHSSMAFVCIQETCVLKLPGLRLKEGGGGLEKPWDFLEELADERNHVYGV
jgi:hypothetical protein